MGLSGGPETTILETPPYFLALLLTFFLILTLGFEKVRCFLESDLETQAWDNLHPEF